MAKSYNELIAAQGEVETIEVGDVYYIPGQKALVSIVLKEGKKDLLQTKY